MRLSEAILLGSTMRPQIRSRYITPDGTCALGAAGEAIGRKEFSGTAASIVWPWLDRGTIPCPDCNGVTFTKWVIQHLNDDHKWTRERIAEWVATIEPKEIPADSGERPKSFVDEKGEKVLEEK